MRSSSYLANGLFVFLDVIERVEQSSKEIMEWRRLVFVARTPRVP